MLTSQHTLTSTTHTHPLTNPAPPQPQRHRLGRCSSAGTVVHTADIAAGRLFRVRGAWRLSNGGMSAHTVLQEGLGVISGPLQSEGGGGYRELTRRLSPWVFGGVSRRLALQAKNFKLLTSTGASASTVRITVRVTQCPGLQESYGPVAATGSGLDFFLRTLTHARSHPRSYTLQPMPITHSPSRRSNNAIGPFGAAALVPSLTRLTALQTLHLQ